MGHGEDRRRDFLQLDEEGIGPPSQLLGDAVEESDVVVGPVQGDVDDGGVLESQDELEDMSQPGFVFADGEGVIIESFLDAVVQENSLDVREQQQRSDQGPIVGQVQVGGRAGSVPDALARLVIISDIDVSARLVGGVAAQLAALGIADIADGERRRVREKEVDVFDRPPDAGDRLGRGKIPVGVGQRPFRVRGKNDADATESEPREAGSDSTCFRKSASPRAKYEAGEGAAAGTGDGAATAASIRTSVPAAVTRFVWGGAKKPAARTTAIQRAKAFQKEIMIRKSVGHCIRIGPFLQTAFFSSAGTGASILAKRRTAKPVASFAEFLISALKIIRVRLHDTCQIVTIYLSFSLE